MAVNLDEIIAGSNSVDDLLQAITAESTAATKSSAQLQKLYAAAEGVASSGSWMQKLKQAITPTSAAGKLQYQKEYNDYVIEMTSQGETPVSREEFLKRIDTMKQSQGKQAG